MVVIRILLDIAMLGRGGAERQVVQLATGLVRRGHRCLLVVHKGIDAYDDELRAGNVEAKSLGRFHRYDARVLPDLVAVHRAFMPDVVLAVEFPATLWGRLAALLCRCPCITAEHASKERFPHHVVVANRLLGGFTRATVACGQAQVPRLVAGGNRQDSIVVINNGVDPAEFFPDADGGLRFRESAGIPADAAVIGLVGVHRVEKRHDRFVRLIEALHESGLDVWGCMVGGGSLLEANRKTGLNSSAADRLVFTGPVSNVRHAYNAMDLVVLLSDTETFPLCFLEAQACGRAVVGIDVGGIRETFLPGGSGVLVSRGGIGQVTREVAALLRSPDDRRAMGDRGRSWVGENMSLEKMVSDYEAVFMRAVAGCDP